MMNKTEDKSWLKKEFDNLLADGEFAKAKRLLEEHKGSIDFADFHYFYSMLYAEQELYHKALSHAKKAYKNSTKNVALREAREDSISILYIVRTYAWVLSSASPKDFEDNSKALNLIDYVISEREKSYSLSKDLLYELNIKSNILYRLGGYYAARENINKTADLFPDSQLPRFIQLLYEPAFSWGNIPGTDDEKLRKFLEDIGYGWAKSAKIDKPNDHTIIISNLNDENKSAKIRMHENKEIATLKNGRIHTFNVKNEYNAKNMYLSFGNGKTVISSGSRKHGAVGYKSSFIKLIMAIVAALISAYIIKVIL